MCAMAPTQEQSVSVMAEAYAPISADVWLLCAKLLHTVLNCLVISAAAKARNWCHVGHQFLNA